MLSVNTTSIESFVAKLRKKNLAIKGNIASSKRNLIQSMFTDLVKYSPQWSGNLTSNWGIEFTTHKVSYKQSPHYSQEEWYLRKASHRGEEPEVSRTLNAELPKIADIKWNTKVYLVNRTPYARSVEIGVSANLYSIRDVNMLNGRVAMVGFVLSKYKLLKNLRRIS